MILLLINQIKNDVKHLCDENIFINTKLIRLAFYDKYYINSWNYGCAIKGNTYMRISDDGVFCRMKTYNVYNVQELTDVIFTVINGKFKKYHYEIEQWVN